MASPRRNVPDQSTEQLRARATTRATRLDAERKTTREAVAVALDSERKARLQTRAAGVAIALLVLGFLIVAHGQRLEETRKTTLRVPALDLTAWSRITADLEDRVPARLLLGGKGPNETLDSALTARGVRRADFQRAASMALRTVGESTDGLASEHLIAAFALHPLPEGIEIPVSRERAPIDRSPELEEARRLVLTLTARLDAPVPENETL